MAITAGGISCRVYKLADSLPSDVWEKAEGDLKRRRFEPVDVERANRSMGWINAQDILDGDVTLDKCRFEEFLLLGLRVDKVTINSKLLKAHFRKAIQEKVKDRQKKQLGREEKTALLEHTRLKLMKAQSPASSFYEAAWNIETGHVYFSTAAKTINQDFCDLFQETFHVGLAPLFPYIRAEARAQKEGWLEELLRVEPERFTLPAQLRG